MVHCHTLYYKPHFVTDYDCHDPQIDLDPVAYIIGGSDAADGAWPFQVALFREPYGFVCGASIISSHVFLTAAHCVE